MAQKVKGIFESLYGTNEEENLDEKEDEVLECNISEDDPHQDNEKKLAKQSTIEINGSEYNITLD